MELSAPILPDELIVEIISCLPVKHIMQLRCFNKFYNTLIFDSHFIQMHLNKSSRNSHLALSCLEVLSVPHLLQNQSTSFNGYPLNEHLFLKRHHQVAASCNGLLLIAIANLYPYGDTLLYFWNPATRAKSKEFAMFSDSNYRRVKLFFGYDNSTQTYKVVAFYAEDDYKPKCVVKVLSLGDNSWRNIQCFPALAFNPFHRDGVHLNGTINWLALRDTIVTVDLDQCVILSLDLSTETYTQLLLPQGFNKAPRYLPKIVVLMDCLCLCHDFEGTHFVIWQMKDFGVQDSWTQLFNISHKDFYKCLNLLPLYLSENGDTLILANEEDKEAFIYNNRDNTVEKIGISKNILWLQAKNYVESLVSTH